MSTYYRINYNGGDLVDMLRYYTKEVAVDMLFIFAGTVAGFIIKLLI